MKLHRYRAAMVMVASMRWAVLMLAVRPVHMRGGWRELGFCRRGLVRMGVRVLPVMVPRVI